MGYENCGARERYPYDELFDGKPHTITATSSTIRALRYGARRRGLRFTEHRLNVRQYEILAYESARVEG